MALVFMSGFEWGTNLEFDELGGNAGTTYKRSGNYSWQLGNGAWIGKSLPQSLTDVYVQFAISNGSSDTAVFFVISKGGTDLVSIRQDSNYRLQVCQGYNGTPYCTGTTVIQPSVWYLIELHFKMDDADGIIELRLDGNMEATFYGDTKPGADNNFNRLRWGRPTGTTIQISLDDVVVCDTTGEVNNGWPDGLKVVLLKPNADGDTLQWTPNPSGSHYTTVDEVPPSATDYLRATEAGLVDKLGLEDLPSEAQSIKAIRLDFWGLKGSMQPPQNIQLGVRTAGNDYFSGNKSLPLARRLVSHLYEQSPAGGNWSVSAINNLELLLKSVE